MMTSTGWTARFPAMASPDFRRLFANGFFVTGSRWSQVLARGWLVHDLSDGSTAAVGWVTFASFIPFVVVGPFVGALADRRDRRQIIILGTIAGIVGASALAVVTLAGVATVLMVGLLAFFTGAAQASTVPTRQALIANVVPADDLLNAIALGGISQHGSRVIGPLIGVAFLGVLGPGWVFVFSAVLLAVGLIAALRIEHRMAVDPTAVKLGPAQAARRMLGDLGAAGSYVRADRRLMTIIALVGVHCSLTMAFDSMMPALSELVGGSETLYSTVLVGLGIGAVTGTLTVSQLKNLPLRGTVFALTALGSGLAMVIMGLATAPLLLLVGAMLAGLTQASYMTMSAALVQGIVSDSYRGRVMSLYIMIAAGHMAILNLGFGQLAEIIDVRLLLFGPGVLWIAFFALAGAGLADVRSLVRRGVFTSPAPPVSVTV